MKKVLRLSPLSLCRETLGLVTGHGTDGPPQNPVPNPTGNCPSVRPQPGCVFFPPPNP